jgi:hypothetical protein
MVDDARGASRTGVREEDDAGASSTGVPEEDDAGASSTGVPKGKDLDKRAPSCSVAVLTNMMLMSSLVTKYAPSGDGLGLARRRLEVPVGSFDDRVDKARPGLAISRLGGSSRSAEVVQFERTFLEYGRSHDGSRLANAREEARLERELGRELGVGNGGLLDSRPGAGRFLFHFLFHGEKSLVGDFGMVEGRRAGRRRCP